MQIAKTSEQNNAFLLMNTLFDIVSLCEASVICRNFRLKILTFYTVTVKIIKPF